MGSGDEIIAADFPPALRSHLIGGEAKDDVAAIQTDAHHASVIDDAMLRQAVRGSDPLAIASSDRPDSFPAHIAHAKRVYLSALIDELHGDLSLIALFWDRGSEKTLRKQIREFGLADRLAAARSGRRRGPA
jgi:hypothetical protein